MHIIARMNVGGPAVEITELMRGLDPDVVSQRLVTGYCNDDEADFLETQAPDISATRVDGLGRTINPTDDAKALGTLVRIIRASRPDIVHTHTAKAGVLGRIAARASGTGAKIVHTHHGHLLHGYFGTIETKVVIQIERQLARITETIVTVGDRIRDDLLEADIGTPGQYKVIRSGVSLGPIPEKGSARRQLGLPDGPVVIAMVGRLTRIKRPDRFAEVVKATRRLGVDACFIVAGGGDQERSLRAVVEENDLPVLLLGWRSDIELILAASDLLLLTSDNEGSPISVIQAGLAGVPVVATRVGSIPEMVEDGVSGFLCDPRVEDIANALKVLSMSPEALQKAGESARKTMRSRFSCRQFLEQHEREYRRVL